MRGEGQRSAFITFIIIAFTFFSYVTSFAGTTTYHYNDVNRKVRIEHGTPGASITYSISGTVSDNYGTSLDGVTVSLTGVSSDTTTTESNGFYRFTGLSNGSYTITPCKAGYTFSPSASSVAISGGNVISQDFTGTLSGIGGPVRIVRTPPVYFETLQAAYNAANSGEVIQSQAVHFDEDVTIDENINVTLDGGYDSNFGSNSGNKTYLKGMIHTTVGGGTVTIKNFVIEN